MDRHKNKRHARRWSVHIADCTVAPSATFAGECSSGQARTWRIYTTASITKLSSGSRRRCAGGKSAIRGDRRRSARFVRSHYNYYRNFETLIRAIAILKKNLHPRSIRLILTANLPRKDNPGIYQADKAAELVRATQAQPGSGRVGRSTLFCSAPSCIGVAMSMRRPLTPRRSLIPWSRRWPVASGDCIGLGGTPGKSAGRPGVFSALCAGKSGGENHAGVRIRRAKVGDA